MISDSVEPEAIITISSLYIILRKPIEYIFKLKFGLKVWNCFTKSNIGEEYD